MAEYIVVKCENLPKDWYVVFGDRREGPYFSLEVANSWAIWFALEELGSWLLDRGDDTSLAKWRELHKVSLSLWDIISDRKAESTPAFKRQELSIKMAEQHDKYQSLLDQAGIAIKCATPESKPEPEQKTGQAKKHQSDSTLDRS